MAWLTLPVLYGGELADEGLPEYVIECSGREVAAYPNDIRCRRSREWRGARDNICRYCCDCWTQLASEVFT